MNETYIHRIQNRKFIQMIKIQNVNYRIFFYFCLKVKTFENVLYTMVKKASQIFEIIEKF